MTLALFPKLQQVRYLLMDGGVALNLGGALALLRADFLPLTGNGGLRCR